MNYNQTFNTQLKYIFDSICGYSQYRFSAVLDCFEVLAAERDPPKAFAFITCNTLTMLIRSIAICYDRIYSITRHSEFQISSKLEPIRT